MSFTARKGWRQRWLRYPWLPIRQDERFLAAAPPLPHLWRPCRPTASNIFCALPCRELWCSHSANAVDLHDGERQRQCSESSFVYLQVEDWRASHSVKVEEIRGGSNLQSLSHPVLTVQLIDRKKMMRRKGPATQVAGQQCPPSALAFASPTHHYPIPLSRWRIHALLWDAKRKGTRCGPHPEPLPRRYILHGEIATVVALETATEHLRSPLFLESTTTYEIKINLIRTWILNSANFSPHQFEGNIEWLERTSAWGQRCYHPPREVFWSLTSDARRFLDIFIISSHGRKSWGLWRDISIMGFVWG